MDMKTLERANIIKSAIDQANGQMEKLMALKDSNEIIIVMNSPKLQEAIKHIYWEDANFSPSYYSGELKQKVMDVLIENKAKWRDKQLELFKKL